MKITEIVQHPLAQRAAITLYILCVIGVISSYIRISTFEVQQALYFQGDSILQAGAPNVLRGVYLHAPSGQFIHPSEFRFTLANGAESPTGGTPVGQGQSGPGGFAHVSLDIPAEFPVGTYDLILEAKNTQHGTFEAHQSVEVVAASSEPESSQWPTKTSRADVAAKNKQQAPDVSTSIKEGLIIDVLPADSEHVRGLQSTVFIRTRDAKTHRPIPARVRLLSNKGILEGTFPDELITDRLGLARLSFIPISDQIWQLEAETSDGVKAENEVRLTTVVTQFSAQLKSPVVISGNPIEGAIYSLFETGAFFVDLYAQDHRLTASAFGLQPGGSGLQLPTPSANIVSADIYRLQVYGDLYNPANSWDSAYIARVQDSSLESLRETAVRTLQLVAIHTEPTDPYFSAILADNLLETATRSELNAWLPAFLLAIPRQFEVSAPLFNTQYADRAELEAWQISVKADLKLLVALILLIGVAVLLHFTLRGIQQARTRSQQFSDSGLESDDEQQVSDDVVAMSEQGFSRLTEIAIVFQGGILLLSLVLFALGVWMLLGYL